MQRKRRSHLAPAVLRTPEKKRRMQWTDEQMVAAMKSVEEGLSGVNQAASLHGVPKTSLKNRLSGRVVHGTKPGPKPYLDRNEEKELAEFLQRCSSVKTRRDVLSITEAYVGHKGIMRKQKISDGWWRRFLERQKGLLVLRKGDS